MNQQNMPPSWESAGETIPEKPEFVKSFTETPELLRPKTVLLAFILLATSTLIFWFLTVNAFFNFEQLQQTILDAMPDDLAEEYSTEDVEKAAALLLFMVGGLSLFLSIIIFLGSVSLTFKQNLSARPVMLVTSLFYLPAAFVFYIVRDGGTQDLTLSIISVALLLLTLALVFTPLVSAWLQQDKKPRKKKLTIKASTE